MGVRVVTSVRGTGGREGLPSRAMRFGMSSSTSRRQHATLAALLALALLAPAVVRADELQELRAENARLKAEVQALSARLEAVQGDARAGGGAAQDGGADASGTRIEPVFIPRTRVSIEVGRDAATGKTNLATLWYRTADVGPLPRKEWFQLRAQQSATGELDGTWLLLERQGAGGGAKVPSARLTLEQQPGAVELTGRALLRA